MLRPAVGSMGSIPICGRACDRPQALAFRTFARELPPPRTRIEALWVHEKCASLRLLAAVRLDERHHTDGPVCLPRLMRTAADWNGRTIRFEVRAWLRSFLRAFDDGHGLRIPVGTAR